MMVSTFAACNKNKTPTHQTPPPSDENTVTTPGGNGGNVGGGDEETTPAGPTVVMPDKIDMNGYTYRAYVRSNASTGGEPMEDGNPSFYCEDFWVDPNAGEPEDVWHTLFICVTKRLKTTTTLRSVKFLKPLTWHKK